MFGFRKKTLEEHLGGTKKVKIDGVVFYIKRINAIDHLSGLNVIQKIYDIYKINKDRASPNAEESLETFKKVKSYCRDIILAGVVSPKLSATEDGDGFFVERLFIDFEMAQALTQAILVLTYKKKLKLK